LFCSLGFRATIFYLLIFFTYYCIFTRNVVTYYHSKLTGNSTINTETVSATVSMRMFHPLITRFNCQIFHYPVFSYFIILMLKSSICSIPLSMANRSLFNVHVSLYIMLLHSFQWPSFPVRKVNCFKVVKKVVPILHTT